MKLKLFTEEDNLSNISNVMMDLDTDNNFIVLGFEYVLPIGGLERLRIDFAEFSKKEKHKSITKGDIDSPIKKDMLYFLN